MKNINKTKIGLMTYLSKQKFGVIIYLIISVVSNLINIAVTIKVATFITEITELNFEVVFISFAMISFLILLNESLYWILTIVFFNTITEVSYRIRKDLAIRSLALSSETYSKSNAGVFIQRITSDPEEALYNLDQLIENIANIFSFGIVIAYIAFNSIYIALILVVALICMVFLEKLKIKNYVKNQRKTKTASEEITSLTNEIIRSEKDIKALGLEDEIKKKINESYSKYKEIYKKNRVVNMHFWNLRHVGCSIFVVIMIFVGMFLLQNHAITVAALLFIFMNRNSLTEIVWRIGNCTESIATCKIACNRMFEIYDEETFTSEKFGVKNVEKLEGNIEFRNVKFSYIDYEEIQPDKSTVKLRKKREFKKTQKQVFENLSFTIEKNKTVAFIGKSGSGKSTILNLISKLYESDSGEILIDGHEIKSLSKASLRNNISLINQFPYIFDMTIADNIAISGVNISEADIVKACKLANLWEFVEGLPNGIYTNVGENGIKLSGGQKQRLAIARAFAKNSNIIIFDESTSSLDNLSQAEIKKSIENLYGTHTIIIVAHRLSTIKNADTIFYLDNGQIVDQGTFDYLYKTNPDVKHLFTAENVDNV